MPLPGLAYGHLCVSPSQAYALSQKLPLGEVVTSRFYELGWEKRVFWEKGDQFNLLNRSCVT